MDRVCLTRLGLGRADAAAMRQGLPAPFLPPLTTAAPAMAVLPNPLETGGAARRGVAGSPVVASDHGDRLAAVAVQGGAHVSRRPEGPTKRCG